MTIRIKPFTEMTAAEFHAVACLRQEVFYLEQRVDCEDLDEVDLRSVFLWAEHEGATIGALRMIPAGIVYAEASIGRVAVARTYRRQGIARAMMLQAMSYIATHWQVAIRISSQEYIVPFYEELGFKTISEPYMEAGIRHRKMRYK